ncbi:hypothetical protein M378DRAFT_162971 [Amanita muscaria Koide BX008]|uniref:BTB domain-containing protein n=1 Tax=Amanita muscaria (strain Koide BX008) TaxID=946122 RepID=A0A0C2SMU5_AMAMK|nr:hypothetical protein M378DRAFT_162971 [Amanita muscaria Koide BX008]
MFSIPQPEGIEPDGSSDEQPLILEGIEKQDFIQLLRILYTQVQRAPGHGFSLDQWKSVLKLSNLYGMIELKNLVVDYMTPLLGAESPSLQIHLAKVYDVPKWLQPAKTRLVERINPIDKNDVRLIGPTLALEVCALREKALRERALHEKTVLENALKDTTQREKVLQEKLSGDVLFPKSKKRKSRLSHFDDPLGTRFVHFD